MTERAMGVIRACGLVGISRSLFHDESRRRVDDEALTGRMMVTAAQKHRYGYRRIHVLFQRDGCFSNHKRIWRLYSKAGLSVRKRRRKRIAAVERTPLPLPTGTNQSWYPSATRHIADTHAGLVEHRQWPKCQRPSSVDEERRRIRTGSHEEEQKDSRADHREDHDRLSAKSVG
nr:IS3 family transposase [Caballeronia calidae]